MSVANRNRKLSSEAQHATAFYSKGPYSAHSAITCAVVTGPDGYHQTVATIMGGHRLAELLNHAHKIANEYPSDIVSPHPQLDAAQIVAHAVAKALGWRLELPHDRQKRLKWEADDAKRVSAA